MVDEVGLVGKEVGGRKVQETVQLWRQMYGRVINDAKEAFYILLLATIVAVYDVIRCIYDTGCDWRSIQLHIEGARGCASIGFARRPEAGSLAFPSGPGRCGFVSFNRAGY